jgi:predicted HTH domain antitoxin
MTTQIIIELPDSAFSILRTTPEKFGIEMRLAAVVKWYELGMVSASKACEVCGLSRCEFLDTLNRFKVSSFQETEEDLIKEFEPE